MLKPSDTGKCIFDEDYELIAGKCECKDKKQVKVIDEASWNSRC